MALCLFTTFVSSVFADDPPQFRAIYVPSFDTNTEARCAEVVNEVLGTNFNQVIVQVRWRGDAAYYPNREDDTYPNPEPRGVLYSISPSDLDILQYYIDRFHNAEPRREVIAWLTTYNSWNRTSPPGDPNHVLNVHPEWITESEDGTTYTSANDAPLDPGIPAVQDYLYNIYMDVVRNYDIDGIHFDYIRLLGADSGFDPVAKAQFLAETGWNYDTQSSALGEVYEAWRRDQISLLMQRVHAQTMLEKPWVDVSAFTVSFTDAVENLGQGYNWWIAHDAIDVLYPSCYSASVAGTVSKWDSLVGKLSQNSDQNKRPMAAAIASYLFLPDNIGYNVQAVNALEGNARKPDGYVFFAKSAIFDDGGTISDQMARELFNPGGPMDEWAPVPVIDHKVPMGEETTPPNAPANVQASIVGGSPRITFSRPAAAVDGDLPVHYRLYRGSDSNVDLVYDAMVMEWWDLDSDRTGFTCDDVLAPSGNTWYAVVAFDDWNNQSVATTGPVNVSGTDYIIETAAGGLNLGDYSETGTFYDSSSHSEAPGTTSGVGSRFALPGDGNGRNDKGRFTPTGIADGVYDVYVTTFRYGSANAENVTARFFDTDGINTTTFDLTAANCGDKWYPIGQFNYVAGSGHYVEIDNSTQTNVGTITDSRMNMAALRMVSAITGTPEPKEPKPPVSPPPTDVTEVIVDSEPTSLNYDDDGSSGNWATSNYPGYYNGSSRYFHPNNFPLDSYAVYIVDLPRAGKWAIDGWMRHNEVFAQGARYRFVDKNGTVVNTSVSQRSTYTDVNSGDWIIDVDGVEDANAYEFNKGRVYVSVWGNSAGVQYVLADALRFRLISEPVPASWTLF